MTSLNRRSPPTERKAMASAEGDLTLEDADKMRVVDLKEALKERNLPTDGKKVRSRDGEMTAH